MPDALGQRFVRGTRYEALGPADQSLGVPPPPVQIPPPDGARVLELPPASELPRGPNVALRALIEERRSVREYAPRALSLEELASLLWCTQGVKQCIRDIATLRTVPSAGARHAFETYILANRVEGLASGLYRYLAVDHGLVEVAADPTHASRLTEACLGQEMVRESAATFVWSAVPYRMGWRYGERGYRYLYLDAGHVCQNLYLLGHALGLGVCAIAAFDDERLDEALGLDGEAEFALYVATVGPRD